MQAKYKPNISIQDLKYSTVLKFHVTLPAQPVPPLTLALTGATGKIASKKHRNREVHKILNNLPESISTQARLGYMYEVVVPVTASDA